LYMLPRIPWVAGTTDADTKPITPFRTSRVIASREKPVASAKIAKRKRLTMNMVLRPNRSATLPKNRRNEPEVKLSSLVFRMFWGKNLRNLR